MSPPPPPPPPPGLPVAFLQNICSLASFLSTARCAQGTILHVTISTSSAAIPYLPAFSITIISALRQPMINIYVWVPDIISNPLLPSSPCLATEGKLH